MVSYEAVEAAIQVLDDPTSSHARYPRVRAAIEAAIAYDEKADGPFEAIEALGEERVFKTKAECVDSTGRICPGVVTQKLGANGLFWGAAWEPDERLPMEDDYYQDDYDQDDDGDPPDDPDNVPAPPDDPDERARKLEDALTSWIRRALGPGFGFLLPQCTCEDVPGPCPVHGDD